MVKRICDKCGTEIGNNEVFIKIIAPNADVFDTECVDLCVDCLRKFYDWMKYPAKLYSDGKACSRALEIFHDDLGLPIRAADALIRNGCFSINDVCNLTKGELLSFKGIGKGSAEEIVTKLAERGRHLREEDAE